jgi:hypothetical protein
MSQKIPLILSLSKDDFWLSWTVPATGHIDRLSRPSFLSTPAFELALDRDRLRQSAEILRPNELHGSAGERVARVLPLVVFGNPMVGLVSGQTDVIRAVRAFQNVNVKRHRAGETAHGIRWPHPSTSSG